jgi:hypothetical protein
MDTDTAAVPQTTMEIAQSVVEQSDAQDTSASESATTIEQPRVLAEHATVPDAKPAPEPELTASQKFLVAQGHKWGKRPDGKTDLSFLPASTVANMLDKFAESHRELWAAEHHSPTVKERDQLKADLSEFMTALRGDDPKAFLEIVAQHDPRYQSFLTPQQAASQTIDDPEPKPDLEFAPGKFTYSLEGQAKREAWLKRQILTEMDQRMKPFADREKAEKERAAHEQMQEQVRTKTRGMLDEAQTWPLFGPLAADKSLTPFQQEVLDTLKADPAISLHQAYMKVVAPRFAEDDAARRARYAQEQNTAPRSTSITRTGAEPIAANKPRTTEDIAREVIMRES